MIRLRWDDQTSDATDWRLVAWPVATIFLQFVFLSLQEFSPSSCGSAWLYGLHAAGTGTVIAAMLYLAPALARTAEGRPLFELVELAIGRIACAIAATASVLYLVCSLGVSIGIVFLLGREWPGRNGPSQLEQWIGVTGMLAFLYLTGIRSAITNARLAIFTVKLTLALGIAVAIRMHPHWQRAWESMSSVGECGLPFNWWRVLGAYAPFAFLAADLSRPPLSRRSATRVAMFGFVLPCMVAIFLADFSVWTFHAARPNLANFIGFGPALWIGDSPRFMPAKAMLLALTMLGIGRLAIRMLDSLVPSLRIQALLGCAVAMIAVSGPDLTAIRDWTSAIVAVAAAAVTARHLTPNSHAPAWTGAAACAAGLLLARILPGIETDRGSTHGKPPPT